MQYFHGGILFVLGIAAAFLAYFAWQHIMLGGISATPAASIPSTVGNGASVG